MKEARRRPRRFPSRIQERLMDRVKQDEGFRFQVAKALADDEEASLDGAVAACAGIRLAEALIGLVAEASPRSERSLETVRELLSEWNEARAEAAFREVTTGQKFDRTSHGWIAGGREPIPGLAAAAPFDAYMSMRREDRRLAWDRLGVRLDRIDEEQGLDGFAAEAMGLESEEPVPCGGGESLFDSLYRLSLERFVMDSAPREERDLWIALLAEHMGMQPAECKTYLTEGGRHGVRQSL